MKILCVLADVPVMQLMADTMKESAKLFGENNEILFGSWLDGMPDRPFGALTQGVEKQGPNVLPVPKFIQDNYDADIIIGAFCPFSREMFDHMPNLKAVCVCRGGIENIDMEAANEHGVIVANSAGRNANAVSDFAVGLMLAEVRNIARSHHNIVTHNQDAKYYNSPFLMDMEGKKVGLVGYGHIGSLVARKLSGFKVQILVYDPYVDPKNIENEYTRVVDKDTLFRESDIVSVHARLTEDTKGLVNAHDISLMKPTAYFINTARAGLVDYDALYEAVRDHKIAGAGLDVFTVEPIPDDSPWLELDNVTLTRHMAGSTVDAQKNSPFIAVNKILDLIRDGNAKGIINKEILDRDSVKESIGQLRN